MVTNLLHSTLPPPNLLSMPSDLLNINKTLSKTD